MNDWINQSIYLSGYFPVPVESHMQDFTATSYHPRFNFSCLDLSNRIIIPFMISLPFTPFGSLMAIIDNVEIRIKLCILFRPRSKADFNFLGGCNMIYVLFPNIISLICSYWIPCTFIQYWLHQINLLMFLLIVSF